MFNRFKTSAALLCGVMLVSNQAAAHGVSTLYSPYVHEGETVLEWKNGFSRHDGNNEFLSRAIVGYGVTSYWQSEIGAQFQYEEGEGSDVNALIFDNKFQLAPKGDFFFDPGLKIEYARSLVGGHDELIASLLLAKQVGRVSHLANFSVGREFRNGADNDLAYGLAYGAAYAIDDHFSLGGEWHSDFGTFNNNSDAFNEQSHRIGPVAYGEFAGIHYETGLLVGVSDEAPDAELKFSVEYAF